jgi:tRNA-binding protein
VIQFDDFLKVDMRTAVIVEVQDLPKAKKPAYVLTVDLGSEIGRKRSSVQCTNYTKDRLVGMQVICVVNFPPKNIAGFASEVLVLGVPGEDGKLSLITPSRPAVAGGPVY